MLLLLLDQINGGSVVLFCFVILVDSSVVVFSRLPPTCYDNEAKQRGKDGKTPLQRV